MKTSNDTLVSLFALIATGVLSANGQPLICNGSFESPDIPFTIAALAGQPLGDCWIVESATTSAVIIDNTYNPDLWFPSPAGGQFAYLGNNVGATVIRQDIQTALQAGAVYKLSFLQCAFAGLGYPGRVSVTVSPTSGASVSVTTNFVVSPNAEWRRQSFQFVPPITEPYTVRFASTQDEVANIDDVSLTVVGPVTMGIGLYPGIDIVGVTGVTYRVEYTTNLTSAPEQVWLPLTNFVLQSSPHFVLDREAVASRATRFYRVVADCP